MRITDNAFSALSTTAGSLAKKDSMHSPRAIAREPLWQPVERFTSSALPGQHRPWLTDDGSLTARLVSLGRGPFSVQRLYQGWQVPQLSEQRLLDLPQRQLALIREVALLVGGTPLVFARSVFPVTSLEGRLGHLRRLQNRSLGAILFRHPGMQRSPFELARLPGDSAYLPNHLHQANPAWGRRSRFDIAGKSLLVSEVFLHDFSPWPTVLPVHRSQRGRVSAAITRPTQ
ncbi:MAG: chorismate--pyruvate lyase [Bacteroidia bacterium]|jgi:chorismate--pyruvate lyase